MLQCCMDLQTTRAYKALIMQSHSSCSLRQMWFGGIWGFVGGLGLLGGSLRELVVPTVPDPPTSGLEVRPLGLVRKPQQSGVVANGEYQKSSPWSISNSAPSTLHTPIVVLLRWLMSKIVSLMSWSC
eukprot:1711776-Amphidinium_carterae.1